MDILRTLRPFSNLGRIWHARWLGHFSPMQILIKPLFIESVIIGALKIKSYQVARPIFLSRTCAVLRVASGGRSHQIESHNFSKSFFACFAGHCLGASSFVNYL